MSDESTGSDNTSQDTGVESQEGQENQEGEAKQAKAPAPPAPKKKTPTYHKFKVGDQEVALTDEDIARDYSKWKGADQKFREAAQNAKLVEDFTRRFHEGDETLIDDKRLPKALRDKLARRWLTQDLEEQLNPPDPRDEKLTAAERELKEYKDREAQAKQAEEDQAKQEFHQTRVDGIRKTFAEAGKLTHLAADPENEAALIREMAVYARAALSRGEPVPDADELVKHLHNSRFKQFYTLAHQFNGEELMDYLGEEIVTRIHQTYLERLKAKRGGGNQQQQQHRSTTPKPSTPGRFIDPSDIRMKLRDQQS